MSSPAPPALIIGQGPEVATAALIVGALTGAISLFSSPEKRTDLRGFCVYGRPEVEAMSSPCVRVQVELLDEQDHALASTATDAEGAFRFYIPQGGSYRVRLKDRKGRTALSAQTMGRGQIARIFLEP